MKLCCFHCVSAILDQMALSYVTACGHKAQSKHIISVLISQIVIASTLPEEPVEARRLMSAHAVVTHFK
jgi:hypothetical protein